MVSRSILLASLLGAGFSVCVFAQHVPLRVQRYTTEDGLAHWAVKAVLQDHKGFLWIGTENGLNKFDGYTFQTFKHDPEDSTSLSDDWITALAEDRAGTLWVGTINGLNRLDRASETFERYYHDPEEANTISTNAIVSLLGDRAGAVWVGTGLGLNRLDPATGQITIYRRDREDPQSLSHNDIVALHEDRAGALWVGTRNGLNTFDPATNQFTRYFEHTDGGGVSFFVMSIDEDPQGRLWLGRGGGGLYFFDPATGASRHHTHNPNDATSLSTNRVTRVVVDRAGQVWAGMRDGGLGRLDPLTGRVAPYRHSPNDVHTLSNDNVITMAEDRSGALWIGTGNGLNRVDPQGPAFKPFPDHPNQTQSLRRHSVRSVVEDAAGTLWVGTQGLMRFGVEGAFAHYRQTSGDPNGLRSDVIWAILPDVHGVTWLTTDTGMGLYDPKTDKVYGSRLFLKGVPRNHYLHGGDQIGALTQDAEGNLWVVGWGLHKLRVAPNPHGLPTAYVDTTLLAGQYLTHVRAAPDGMLWVTGGGSGLYHINLQTGAFTPYRHDPNDPHSLSNNLAFYTHIDAAGTLWVGTKQGLNRFDPETQRFERFLAQDGLASDYIHSIISDEDGILWLSTDIGLARFDPAAPPGDQFRNFDASDGAQARGYHVRSVVRRQDGAILFGGTDGITWFHPDALMPGTEAPPMVLTAFRKFGQNVRFDRDLTEVDHIELKHDENVIAFEFAALDYAQPERTQYAYKLEGFPDDWVYSGNRRTAYYTNLDPGVYTFRAKGANHEGVWNEDGLAITVVIRPPFWQTWWFRSVALAALLAMVYFVYHVRVRRLEQAKTAQERFSRRLIAMQEQERERIARELHDSLGQNLLMIKNGLEHAIGADKNGGASAKDLAFFSEIAQASIDEVRTISSDLHPHQLRSLGLTMAIEAAMQKLNEVVDVPCTASVDSVDGLFSKDEEIHVYRMIQEGVNNAVRHAEAQTIAVTVRRRDGAVVITIVDDGKGFDVEAQRANHNGRQGLGLTGLAERARMLGGAFTVKSTPGQGTTLKLYIPR